MGTHSKVLARKAHEQRRLVGYSPWGSSQTWLSSYVCIHVYLSNICKIQCVDSFVTIIFNVLSLRGNHAIFCFAFIFYWSIVDLWCCISLCCTWKWIRYMYIDKDISPPCKAALPPLPSYFSRWLQSTKMSFLCFISCCH